MPRARSILPTVDYQGQTYNARAYAGAWGTRYLGVTPDGRVFGLGDFTGEQLQQFDTITHWAPQIMPDWCARAAVGLRGRGCRLWQRGAGGRGHPGAGQGGIVG